MENNLFNERSDEEVNIFIKQDTDVFKKYFEGLSNSYRVYLSHYFVVKEGVILDEFRFINAGR